MLPSNTNILRWTMNLPGIQPTNAQVVYHRVVYTCVQATGLYMVSISLMSRLCVPPTILTERVESEHETR